MNDQTTFVACPADGDVLVPHLTQEPYTALTLRCTKCAFHLYLARPASGNQNNLTLPELETALTAARIELQLTPNGREQVLCLQVDALVKAVRRLNPQSPALADIEYTHHRTVQPTCGGC